MRRIDDFEVDPTDRHAPPPKPEPPDADTPHAPAPHKPAEAAGMNESPQEPHPPVGVEPTHRPSEFQPVTLTINFNPLRTRMGRSFRILPITHEGARITLTWADPGAARDGAAPTTVTLHDPDGVTAADLSHFPWARWIRVATAHQRTALGYTVQLAEAARRLSHEAAPRSLPHSEPPKRGRPRYDDEFWERIRRRYLDLVAAGTRSPVARIAREEEVPRNTAAAWIATLRKREQLPPGRRGKAG